MSLCVDMWPCLVPMTSEIKVKRCLPTPLNYGRRQGTPRFEDLTVAALVQPLVTKDVRKDAEGDRNEGRIEIFSLELLIAQRTDEGIEGDVVEYQGVDYEVYLSQDWREFANYVRSEAKRIRP